MYEKKIGKRVEFGGGKEEPVMDSSEELEIE